jgi:V8-like Glu-specific endopeptidase
MTTLQMVLVLWVLAVVSLPHFFTVDCNGISSLTRRNLRSRSQQQQQQRIKQRRAIVGGENADPNRYPAVVYLADREDNLSCGATLISPTVLLTAAHCEM